MKRVLPLLLVPLLFITTSTAAAPKAPQKARQPELNYLSAVNVAKPVQSKPKSVKPKPEPEYQIFEVTAYTAGPESTGKKPGHPLYGITASGKKVKENHTLACPKSMPFGTKVYIKGIGIRTCEDRGAAITEGHLDIYIPDLREAKKFGRQKLKVQIIPEGSEPPMHDDRYDTTYYTTTTLGNEFFIQPGTWVIGKTQDEDYFVGFVLKRDGIFGELLVHVTQCPENPKRIGRNVVVPLKYVRLYEEVQRHEYDQNAVMNLADAALAAGDNEWFYEITQCFKQNRTI